MTSRDRIRRPFQLAVFVRGLALAAALTAQVPVTAQGMFGPGKFRIEQADDRFSADNSTMAIGHNNRVSSKSPAGGIFVSSEGIYLEPIVVKDRSTGAVLQTGFVIRNQTERDTLYGSPNTLGTPEAVSFLLGDGQLIRAEVSNPDEGTAGAAHYNSVGHYVTIKVAESGTVTLSPAEMAALASASSVAIKIEGSERSVTYEERDIAKAFLPNVRTFYREQIATTVR